MTMSKKTELWACYPLTFIHFRTSLLGMAIFLGIALLTGCEGQQGRQVLSFTETSIILEHNSIDGDGEIVVFVKGGDDGLGMLRVTAPNGVEILRVSSKEKVVGLREFSLETAEPEIGKVRIAYPEGVYRFDGMTQHGQRLSGNATLSHALPTAPSAHFVAATNKVSWEPDARLEGYRIEVEREENGEDTAKLTMDLPADAASFTIPKAFHSPGSYQLGLAAIGKNGNIVVVEKEYTIK